jgi:hypothetical protein
MSDKQIDTFVGQAIVLTVFIVLVCFGKFEWWFALVGLRVYFYIVAMENKP